MATISVGAGNIMRPYRNVRMEHFPEDAGQTFLVGDIVVFSATSGKENKIKLSGADPTASVVGVAAEAASGVEGTMIGVWVANNDGEFLANVQDTGTLAATNVGSGFGVVRDATNLIWRVDLSETSAKVVDIVKLIDAVGDVNGLVVCKFRSAIRLPFTA